MKLEDLVRANRSYRRFHENKPIAEETLLDLINLARLTPSAANRQPLKYMISTTSDWNRRIFARLSWAGYLTDWEGPAEGEQPSAYIIILGDTSISKEFGCDHGIAAQTIMLGAAEKGVGGCIVGSVDRKRLSESLGLVSRYEILLVLALGYPSEEVVLEDVGPDGDVKYYRDSQGAHHVPKRSVQEIIVTI